jgi:hypothetical protein
LHSPEQKKFFTSSDVNELFEYPSRSKRRAQFHVEDAPAKQRKTEENLILTSLLDADGIKREDLSNSPSLDPGNIQETTRVRAHAELLAQKARDILVKSRSVQYRGISATAPSVLRIRPSIVRFGTIQAQEILTRVRGSQCGKKETAVAVTVEELTVKRLYQFFNENQGKASSKAIIAHINLKLRDFDAYLVKAVLRSIATLQRGIWTLKPQFRE